MRVLPPAALRALCTFAAFSFVRVATPAWCGRDAEAWYTGNPEVTHGLAAEVLAFEEEDSRIRHDAPKDRYTGEWALVTHQMIALGLGQLIVANPADRPRYAAPLRAAALRSFLPEMRDFGTEAWDGEDALSNLSSSHGHAYLAYAALAVGMARWLDPSGFPASVARDHDALIAAYERRLLEAPNAIIETYPGQAFPTDIAAVAAAIAMHARATGADHRKVLLHWVSGVRKAQIDPASGFVHQRLQTNGQPLDVPRGSGTGLAAYYASFVDGPLTRDLTDALAREERTFAGFGAIGEFVPLPANSPLAKRPYGHGDIDSGPVIFGVSVAATGFSLAPLRNGFHDGTGRNHDAFVRVFRTTSLFGMPATLGTGGATRFRSGGPIGNALLFAMLTARPLPILDEQVRRAREEVRP
jgi:hypothetical protein